MKPLLTILSKGTIGCIWYIFWVLIVRESPAKDKFISKDELRYIQESIGSRNSAEVKHPWKSIFTSKAVYAICASHFAENWGFYTLLTQLPSFLKGMTSNETCANYLPARHNISNLIFFPFFFFNSQIA